MLRLRCSWRRTSTAWIRAIAPSYCPHLGNQKQFSVSINRCGARAWTPHERQRLVVEMNSGASIHDIATILERPITSVRAKRAELGQAGLLNDWTSKKPFTPEEDASLLAARSQGLGWTAMREQFPGRSQNSLRIRFARLQSSHQNIARRSRTQYTPEEDQLIIETIHQSEMSWKDLAKQLPNRSLASLKSRYHNLSPASARVHRLQANRFAWDEDQTDQLRHLSAHGLSVAAISRKLAKSYGSTRAKLQKLRFSPPEWTSRSQPRKWTADEVAWLRELHEEGVSRGDIAMKLNRPFGAVESKLHSLPDISIRGRVKKYRSTGMDTKP